MPTILVVEDDIHFLQLCKEKFEDEGLEVLTAQNGKEALKIFEEKQDDIDAITIDILLPDIDGIRLLRELVKKNEKIPKFMLSAFDYRDDFAVWASNAYFVKSPDVFEEMIPMIKSWIERYRKENPK